MGIMARTDFDKFVPLLAAMMKQLPEHEEIPTLNRPAAAMGLIIPFHILSWVAVGFRLHTRLRVVRDPGWDDLFVVIAAVVNLVGMIAFFIGLQYGIGRHLVYIIPVFETTMIWFYVTTATYTTTAVCIKTSLLLQYLRMFREGYRRIITIVMLVLVSLWGAAFMFMAWFPCFPISGFWNKHMSPPARCYGFGFHTTQETKATLLGFSGSNMSLDLIILLIPLTEYFKPGLKKKQVIAMTGLFAMGGLVVLMAILRLWAGLKNRYPDLKLLDFTFWLPEVLIFSCLEIDFAIIAASMPIFWPTVMASWTQIFVTNEVFVTRDRRSALYQESQMELERTHSMRSHTSSEVLTKKASADGKSWLDFDPALGRGVELGINNVNVQDRKLV